MSFKDAIYVKNLHCAHNAKLDSFLKVGCANIVPVYKIAICAPDRTIALSVHKVSIKSKEDVIVAMSQFLDVSAVSMNQPVLFARVLLF